MALDTTVGGNTSDSYVTLLEFQAYWLARNVILTQHGHDESHEADLRKAAQFIDGGSFVGQRVTYGQARAFPRYYSGLVDGFAMPSDTIPQAVKDAQCEMAYLIHEGADPFATFEGGVSSESASAGPVSTSKTFAGAKSRPEYTAVSMLLRPYRGAGSGQARLLRG